MKVLVVGAEGFLGRHVVAAFARHGADVAATPPVGELDLTRLQPGTLGDVLRGHAGGRPDVLVNAAGLIAGPDSELWRANADLPALLAAACDGARLVHLGSAAEYGPPPGEDGVLREDAPARPANGYGRSKLAGTRALAAAHVRGDADAVVLRVFNPLGAGQPAGSLPGRVAAQLRELPAGEPVRTGPLDGERDFLAAADVGAAVLAAALAPRRPAALVVNCGSGAATPVRDLVLRMLELDGGGRGLVEEDPAGSPRSAAVRRVLADPHAAAAHLGWSAGTPLDAALDAVLQRSRRILVR